MVGNGQLFKRHEALLARPDPRRLDLRASVLDPFGQYRVRAYQEHDRVEVMVLADLSASLAYAGRFDKREVLATWLKRLPHRRWLAATGSVSPVSATAKSLCCMRRPAPT
ncbi:hypothetical protein [Methylomonas koyamae]|uniref:hypothetical protein n=1 Tax=Methylomonas koyamae TaxID=702114 RepID=UPI000B321F6C|nr:hypothetical protein [Methylomonas koyamae]